jgi:alpha-L-rhamnosidase
MDWQAKWIWAGAHIATRNCYIYARRKVEIEPTTFARVLVTCRSAYKLYINGRYIGRGPGPCPPGTRYYDEYDVTHVLRPGKNVLAANCYHLGDGDAVGAGFLLQLELTNGDPVILTTDETWRVKTGDDWDFGSRRMSSGIGFQEVYDSRRKPVGWNVVGFDDSGWETPALVDEQTEELLPRQIPRLRESEVFPESVLKHGTVVPVDEPSLDIATRMRVERTQPAPSVVRYANSLLRVGGDAAAVEPGPAAFITIDFGRKVVGFPVVRIRDGGQGTIDIAYSEALDGQGDVDPTRQSILQADRLILHGGRQEWQTFSRRVFRFIQLTVRDLKQSLHIESVSVICTGYPVEQVSTFECSDDLLNRIWQTGVYTQSLCMQDSFEDSPISGHSCRIDGLRIQALANYYSFRDTTLVAAALSDLERSAEELIIWPILLHDYYMHTGDRSLVASLYPAARRLLNPSSPASRSPAHQAFRYQALRDAAKLASAVGEVDDAVALHDQAEAALRMFGEEYRIEENSDYTDDDVALANALAVSCDLADFRQRELISASLGRAMRDSRLPSPPALFYVLSAMAALGMEQEALDLIRRVWGGMLERGATTWWETFDPAWAAGAVSPDSLCHGPSGAPTVFLPSEVLGVKPSLPESTVVVIRPMTGHLEWARGRVKLVRDYVEVEWRFEDGRFRIDIDAPGGFIVALPVGGFTSPVIEEIDLSPETPERRARETYGWGHVIWRDGEQRDPYIDWLHEQEEPVPESYFTPQRCAIESDRVWVRESVFTHVRYVISEGSTD